MKSPAVITSREAKKHFEKIKAQHAEIVADMSAHQERVQQYKQQKEQERQQEVANTKETARQEREFMQKQSAIDIKRAPQHG